MKPVAGTLTDLNKNYTNDRSCNYKTILSSTTHKTIVLYVKTLKNYQQKFIYFLRYRHYRVASMVLAKKILAITDKSPKVTKNSEYLKN